MRARSHSRLLLAAMAVLAGLLSAGIHSGCSSNKSPAKPPLEALFDEGRATFYETVADDVDRHPLRDQLNAAEKAKIRDLQNVYPRLYGILMNYYYQKDAPVFQALLDEAGEASQRRFREKYLDTGPLLRADVRRQPLSAQRVGALLQGPHPAFQGQGHCRHRGHVHGTYGQARPSLPPTRSRRRPSARSSRSSGGSTRPSSGPPIS